MIIGQVMDELGNKLSTIPRLRGLPYEADEVEPPAYTISLPPVNYNSTYGNGQVVANFLITIFVSLANDRKRRDEITPYQDSSGVYSVRQALEIARYQSIDSILVKDAIPAVIKIGAIEYYCLIFNCEVVGRG